MSPWIYHFPITVPDAPPFEAHYRVKHCSVKVLTLLELLVAQSCPTLSNPPVFSVHRVLQARILEWVAIPSSRGSS